MKEQYTYVENGLLSIVKECDSDKVSDDELEEALEDIALTLKEDSNETI